MDIEIETKNKTIVIDGKKYGIVGETAELALKILANSIEPDIPNITSNEIPVPKEIKICNEFLKLSKDQCLYFAEGNWKVGFWGADYEAMTEMQSSVLIPCKREELKAGDLAFRADAVGENPERLERYCIILDEKKHVFIEDDGRRIVINDYTWNYWYKVVKK